MKIMILANNDAGLYMFRKELLEELMKKHEVIICIPKGDYTQELLDLGCKFICCDCLERKGKNPIKDVNLYRFYKRLFQDTRPDIVFTYTIKPNCYGGMACAKLKIPYVVNITGLGVALENEGTMQKVALLLYKMGIRKAQKVFFQNSENLYFMKKKKIVKENYDLLPGSGVNLDRFEVLEYPNSETVDFLFVGRTMKEKGIEQYFDAAKYICKKYPNTRFHICGASEQDYSEQLEKLQEENVIVFHGIVKEMINMYKIAACTVHPSYYPEGMSNVLLESAACARPIITTDRPGCGEVIDDGINGFICKQKDSQNLIRQIERFLALSIEERREMGLAGRRKVEKEFDRQIVVEKYLAELKE